MLFFSTNSHEVLLYRDAIFLPYFRACSLRHIDKPLDYTKNHSFRPSFKTVPETEISSLFIVRLLEK
jgi:hypothetical protein